MACAKYAPPPPEQTGLVRSTARSRRGGCDRCCRDDWHRLPALETLAHRVAELGLQLLFALELAQRLDLRRSERAERLVDRGIGDERAAAAEVSPDGGRAGGRSGSRTGVREDLDQLRGLIGREGR